MFRCAKDGMIADLFAQAGLKHIAQAEVPGKLNCQTAETYWSFVSEVVGPVVSALGQVDGETKEKIRAELFQLVHDRYPAGNVMIDASSLIISGQK